MKSFLDNRQEIGQASTGKISAGTEFTPMKTSSSKALDATDAIPSPEQDGDSPKVELVKDGERVTHIIVSFGDQSVEVKCEF